MLRNKKIYTDEQKEVLWERYNSGNKSVYQDLCEAYLPLVEIIASNNKSRLPDQVEVDDLISDGFFGLADAIEKYDSSVGAKFDTYATSRIRGAIYDRLRDYDPISRHYRGKFKQVTAVTDALSEIHQRVPTDSEVAKELRWDIAEVQKIRSYYVSSFTVNIDEYITDGTHESFSLADVLADDTIGDADFQLQEQEITDRLIEGLESLSDQESLVVFWKHEEGLNFREIGERLSIKVPRVSRIYSGAMKKLRQEFDNQ